ncbi:hypothetical protein [Micromonospora eburnea]|uniref:DUF4386 family protein n=1 Tax=Micromonospora eburnea TaxID=227316 RepID=A0A1C6VP09_9ACTN|nr:hypothetical protein [Micromonospora eburnea]SCL68051.1 hypothetical protein GA0070604_6182 [Micromonospora eburnea]
MSMTRTRAGAAALAVAGLLFILYPATRPWEDETTMTGATAAMSSSAWVASHLFAMIGFILLPLGLLTLPDAMRHGRGGPLARAAAVTTWIGAGLTLPYYGAEDFGLHAIAARVADGQSIDLLDLAETVRFQPVAATTFGLGLATLAAGAVMAGIAIWRSGVLPRYSGIPLAVGFALFLPQFFTPPAFRITHGVLVGIGCAWVAVTLWRTAPRHP